MNPQENTLSWKIQIPLINNRFMLWTVAKAIVLTLLLFFIIMGTAFGLTGGSGGLAAAFIFCFWGGVFIILVSIFTLGVVLGNKYLLEFIIDDKGITMKSQSKRAKAAHRLALILGLLARNKAATGAGLSAMSTETIVCTWGQIHSVKLYPDKRVVAIKQNFLQTMYVYCTKNNFESVSSIITQKASKIN